MGLPRFYIDADLAPGMILPLPESIFGHAVRVLRLQPGDGLCLFNGQGGEYAATLLHCDRRSASVTINNHVARDVESPLHVILGQGISRGEKMDYTLQKAVELGVSEIVPLFSDHGNIRLEGERLEKRLDHWRGIIASACEQCGRTRLPILHATTDIEYWIDKPGAATRLMLDPDGTLTPKKLPVPRSAIAILIGPEGGISSREAVLAKAAGFVPIRLGPRILRTETAAVATLSAIQTLWGDMGDQSEK